jgi:hypothetical protein
MNYKILGLVVALLTAPKMVNAQTETLVYTGNPFTSVSITGNVSDGLANAILQNSGELVLSSPLGDNLHNFAVTPVSWSFDGNTPNGIFLNSNNPFPGPDDVMSFRFSTDANGMLTAWNIVVSGGILQGTSAHTLAAVTINNSAGDSFSSSASNPSCGVPPGPPPGCFAVTESGGAPGVWGITKAPEIDSASAASGLTLLLAGLAVLRGRRTQNRKDWERCPGIPQPCK